MKLVLIESPYADPDYWKHENKVLYAEAALKDSLVRGEAPFASHLLYTMVLDDDVKEERERGIEAGLAWGKRADLTAVYWDLGISEGMWRGIRRAQDEGRAITYRSLGKHWGERSETEEWKP